MKHFLMLPLIALLFTLSGCVTEPEVAETGSRKMEGEENAFRKLKIKGYEDMCKREPESKLCEGK